MEQGRIKSSRGSQEGVEEQADQEQEEQKAQGLEDQPSGSCAIETQLPLADPQTLGLLLLLLLVSLFLYSALATWSKMLKA
ncbi:hypothetical protein DPEC_G00362150 [Dallia pectoralis]|nr:hypothetical protein DPEC_G00362150 [Dallia pectoralis]